MRRLLFVTLILVLAVSSACNRRRPAVAAPTQPPPAVSPPGVTAATPPASTRIDESLPVPPQPIAEDSIANRSLDDLNRDSPLKPVFFALDSAELDDLGRTTAAANADLLKKYPTWTVTIEGHSDERGTAEYNLSLGERRAMAVKTYLVSLGIAQDRVRTVSYGKEFPFDPGHTEEAWSKNRRGHFVITAK